MYSVVDLHTHSSASDGQYAPQELVCLAKQHGLNVLALTDHDTLDGLGEAILAGEQVGLHILRGIELGALEHRNLHILGYGFSADAPHLSAFCQKMKQMRHERKHRIISFLKEKNIHISLSEVEELAGTAPIGRPHFAQVMLRHGYVSTLREAFDRYLDTEEYQQIDRFKECARLCIETIHADGGKVSFAHPYQLKMENAELEKQLKELVSYGLDAIECYYPKHTPEQTAFYFSLAEKYGLHVTGGSDFHGERVKPDISLTATKLDLSWLGISPQ